MESINDEFNSLDPDQQQHVRKIELEAEHYLWYPNPDSMKNIRVLYLLVLLVVSLLY